jgi:hypothetical protein
MMNVVTFIIHTSSFIINNLPRYLLQNISIEDKTEVVEE